MTITFIPFNITQQGIFLTHSGETRLVPTDSQNFDKVKDAIKNSDWESVWELSDSSRDLKRAVEGSDFQVVDGVVHVEGVGLPDALSKRIIAFSNEGLPSLPLLSFWRNLRQNPSFRARKALFEFLDKQGHPITEDGCFIAYKRVDENFCSYHATPEGKKLSHKVGEFVSMPREEVDDDPTNTCSSGLHVANYNYASKSYYSGCGHLLDIKVNPKDVVAIPVDYNGEKMRVCAYEVVAVAEGERVNENLYKYEKEDFLDDEEDNIEVDGLSFYNNFQDCYRVLSRQSRIYNSQQYNQGYRKAEKDLDFDNDFNIIRDRFKSFTETETLSWIAGYVDKWSEYEGFDRATWVEGYDDEEYEDDIW